VDLTSSIMKRVKT